jgi:MFS family permease
LSKGVDDISRNSECTQNAECISDPRDNWAILRRSTVVSVQTISSLRRWSMLVVALTATMCANVLLMGVAFLIPTLHIERDLHLAQAGLFAAMPILGTAATLIPWGYLVDWVGEKIVLVVGMGSTAAATFAAAAADSLVMIGVFLFLGGMAAASNNAASGRLVVGWFPPERRGLVMGIRHTASPLAVALSAMVIPQLADHHGVAAALLFPAVLSLVSTVLSGSVVLDPPRLPRTEAPLSQLGNPYRGSKVLWQIHAVSVVLAVPQSVVWTFTLVWLMADGGWSAQSASVVVIVAQLFSALARVAAGHWSDHLGARIRPIRMLAIAVGLMMLLLALTDQLNSPLSVAVVVAASALTVADNGLAFTAIAEMVGPFWSGRALGIQYTSQMLAMGSAPPVFGALIAFAGYPVAFTATGPFRFSCDAASARPCRPAHHGSRVKAGEAAGSAEADHDRTTHRVGHRRRHSD